MFRAEGQQVKGSGVFGEPWGWAGPEADGDPERRFCTGLQELCLPARCTEGRG